MSEKRFTMDNESDIIKFDYNTNVYIQGFRFADGKSWDRICNRLNELYEENEQLKQDNQRLIKMLDNVANYMQKEHREIPLDDFVEWWNKMATEGLEND